MREEVSTATVRTPLTPCCARTIKMMERTRSSAATVQPGRIISEGVVAWGSDGNQAYVGFACRQFRGTAGGCGVANLVAQSQAAAYRLVLEVPH